MHKEVKENQDNLMQRVQSTFFEAKRDFETYMLLLRYLHRKSNSQHAKSQS